MKNFDLFGVMIDCSRNAVPNIDGLKRFLKIISEMGYNCAMLYTEDTYEVKGEPYFGYKRGRYSMAELRELDDYAFSIGVELIPCIQTLAHLNAAFRWQEYRKIQDCDDILLLNEERTSELLLHMFETTSGCFRSRRIHIGMDEAHRIGLGRYLDKHGFTNRYELLLRHLHDVCRMAKQFGYEPIMWEDMFFRLAHGEYFSDHVVDFSEEIKKKIPSDITMVYWDYYGNSAEYYENMIRSSKNLSDKVWFAGGAWVWGGFAPHNRLSIRRNQLAIPVCIREGIRNAFFTMWGDNGGECPYFSALPALMHAVAVAEGMTECQMKDTFRKIVGDDYDAFLALDLPNYVLGETTSVGSSNYSKNRLYNDPFLGILDLNADKADSAVYPVYASRLHRYAEKSRDFGFLFETMATLCDALAIKFDLSYKTRQCYTEKDKAGLKILAEKDYTELLKRLEQFYLAFQTQWYTVNKTYGFEIQDARLGGLMQRIKSCRMRILSYCNGASAAIDELSEPVLPNDGGNVPFWKDMISANII